MTQPTSAAQKDVLEIKGTAVITPELVAELWWGLGSDEQAQFFAHLYRIGGWKLSMQMLYVAQAISEMEGVNGVMGLNSFAEEGKSYVSTAIEYRGRKAYQAIEQMAARATRESEDV